MSSANKDSTISSFLIDTLFLFLSLLFALDEVKYKILKRNDLILEKKNIVCDLGGKKKS